MASVAQAQGVDPALCSQISDRDARLACFDRAFPPGTGTNGSNGTAAQRPPMTVASPGAATAAGSTFGLPVRPQAAAPADTAQLSSSIPGTLDGWSPGTRFKLANGQVWAVDESSRTAGYGLRDPKVKVVEGAFGGYYLEIEGVSKTPRVKRVE